MKAEELMIGDWVRIVDDDTDQSFETRITGVSGLGNIYAPLPDGEHAYPFSVDCIVPIPLTAEILEKNGFVKQGFPGWEICTEDFLILWRNDYPDVLEIRCFNAAYGSFHRSHISYVHELQHALRLCGIDKTIQL